MFRPGQDAGEVSVKCSGKAWDTIGRLRAPPAFCLGEPRPGPSDRKSESEILIYFRIKTENMSINTIKTSK